ncbi:hypothetical protein BS78_06G042900 [Paspalum vaginatum]|nr:hypothetical protein BS78_06G042900 [Paspalum vaginatum]
MVATRRSAQRSGHGLLRPDGATSQASPSLPQRLGRDASLPQRSGRVREKGGLVISDQTVEAEKQWRHGKEDVVIENLDEVDEDLGSLDELPGWLPDGWIMEICQEDNGSIYRYYTSPVSGYTFTSKMETLHYLFSGVEERMLETQANARDDELHVSYAWLPCGWVIEIRAGGKKMDKMYKFYVHLPTGKRFMSKAEVLLFVDKGMVSMCNMDVLCDASTDDNILAHVEFNPDGLPDGWVKETIFRKCNDGIRKDPYYTDPVSHRVFRTLKSVLSYLGTGEISKHAYLPRRNVIDTYSFDKCADLPQSMLKRLKAGQTKQKSMRALSLYKELPNDQTSKHWGNSAGLNQSNQKEDMLGPLEGTDKNGNCSETIKRQRGRPKKILKQTNGSISNCDNGSCKVAKNVKVKEEGGIDDWEDLPNEKTLEHTGLSKNTVIIEELDNNTTEKNLLKRKGGKSDLLTVPRLHEQENVKLTEGGEKATCSSVHKFYKRRNGNRTLGSRKG